MQSAKHPFTAALQAKSPFLTVKTAVMDHWQRGSRMKVKRLYNVVERKVSKNAEPP